MPHSVSDMVLIYLWYVHIEHSISSGVSVLLSQAFNSSMSSKENPTRKSPLKKIYSCEIQEVTKNDISKSSTNNNGLEFFLCTLDDHLLESLLPPSYNIS